MGKEKNKYKSITLWWAKYPNKENVAIKKKQSFKKKLAIK